MLRLWTSMPRSRVGHTHTLERSCPPKEVNPCTRRERQACQIRTTVAVRMRSLLLRRATATYAQDTSSSARRPRADPLRKKLPCGATARRAVPSLANPQDARIRQFKWRLCGELGSPHPFLLMPGSEVALPGHIIQEREGVALR